MRRCFAVGGPLFLLVAVLVAPIRALAQSGPDAADASSGANITRIEQNRTSSYYHYGLAKLYEDQAVANGRQDLATQAVEQYKLALDGDPDSRLLSDGLANLYFRLGRIREAVSSAQDQVNKHPDDVEAHLLLGRIYLRSLGDGQGPQTSDMLQAAIKEYEKIVQLKPDTETRLLLGQLYGLNHDSAKAEEQFKEAQKNDPNNEEVVLSMARMYSEQGDLNRAVKVIADVPEDDRTSRMNFALGGLYDSMKQPKLAAAAYQAVVDEDPENADAKKALAGALQASGQMDAAAKIYTQILGADPSDPQTLIHEAELQRNQGHYEQSLATLKKAEALTSSSLELSYNVALNYDSLGRFDDAIDTLKEMLATSASPNGKYDDADKSNRALFLDRLGIVAREANKTAIAVDAYKELGSLGSDMQQRGYDGQVDAYRDAHKWAQALEVAAAAAAALPQVKGVQLTYARQLADATQVDQGLKLANAQLLGTPDDRETLFTIADIQVRARRWKDASATLDKVEAISPKPEDKVFLDYYRGTVAERQKLFDQAEIEFRKGLSIDPDNVAIENYLGYMFAERGMHLTEAVTMLKKAVDFEPQDGAYLDSLAWAYFKQGQYALAEEYARKAVIRLSTDPAVLDHLGEIEARNGKLQQAIGEWQRSIEQYATSLPPEADPADVAKVQRKLEVARIRLAHSGVSASKQ